MAIYRLGEKTYSELEYDQEIWKGRGGSIAYMLSELYPGATKTTEIDRKKLRWLYGMVVGGGRKGTVQVMYPYQTESVRGALKLKNVEISLIPYTVVRAEPETGYKFLGWKGNVGGDFLLTEKELILTEGLYENITTFYAVFE